MKPYVPLLSVLVLLAAGAPSRAADITGVWLTQSRDAHVRIAKCGTAVCGTLVWLRDRIDPKTGKPPTDENNRDPAKRSRPLLGLRIASDFRPSPDDKDKLVGTFYNADDGNTYRGSISRPNPNELRVEGCLLVICQSQIWTRVKR